MPIYSAQDMVSDAYTEAWLIGPQLTKFYTRTYLAPPGESKAAIVFIHGFADHVGRYTEAHPQLAAHGFNVFTFDQRGFGKTALDLKNKSWSSTYGKTSGEQQMDDIQWAIDHAETEFPGLPVFLSGHSMGGGEVLNFAVRRDTSVLAGVIASSPLVRQTNPIKFDRIIRAAGGWAAILLPYLIMSTPLNYNDLSHDAEYTKFCATDVLAKLQGTLRGVLDMINWGEELLNGKKWPKTLPILFLHGSADQITSHTATNEFHNKIETDDKTMIVYPDGFHELLQEPAHKEKLIADEIAWIEAHC
ncbi:lysophospholipase [Mycena galopus ATCC 62051]|nr:lysophospholipase [Mycena galopus ATCC 62051]